MICEVRTPFPPPSKHLTSWHNCLIFKSSYKKVFKFLIMDIISLLINTIILQVEKNEDG